MGIRRAFRAFGRRCIASTVKPRAVRVFATVDALVLGYVTNPPETVLVARAGDLEALVVCAANVGAVPVFAVGIAPAGRTRIRLQYTAQRQRALVGFRAQAVRVRAAADADGDVAAILLGASSIFIQPKLGLQLIAGARRYRGRVADRGGLRRAAVRAQVGVEGTAAGGSRTQCGAVVSAGIRILQLGTCQLIGRA